MKALSVGDQHLGAGTDYGRVPGERLAEQEAVWDRIVDIAIEHEVDALLHAGDVFERRRPTPSEMLAFLRPLQRLNEYDIDVLVAVGNHDVEAFDRPTGVELFTIHADVHREPRIWQTRGLTVATLPWTPVANLVARNGGGDRDELNARAAELLLDTARELRGEIAAGGPAILMLHWSVSGASLPTGLPTDTLREPVIPLAELEQLGFDAIVMGHIHKSQEIATDLREPNMPIFYVGSPMPLNFGEANVAHGVWILESHPIGTRGALSWTPTFVPIESRPCVTFDWPAEMCERADFPDIDAVMPPIVKVRYKATAEQARRIDHAAMRQALLAAGAHKVYAIEATIERPQRARVEGLDEGLSPWEALTAYTEANSIDDDTAKVMYARTREYVQAVGA